jgi:hypothetical protein
MSDYSIIPFPEWVYSPDFIFDNKNDYDKFVFYEDTIKYKLHVYKPNELPKVISKINVEKAEFINRLHTTKLRCDTTVSLNKELDTCNAIYEELFDKMYDGYIPWLSSNTCGKIHVLLDNSKYHKNYDTLDPQEVYNLFFYHLKRRNNTIEDTDFASLMEIVEVIEHHFKKIDVYLDTRSLGEYIISCMN